MPRRKAEAAPADRPRDREETERLILSAAKQVLAEDGFAGFGVNAIARRAGCDKQLVYRYFGGLDGLVDAIGADIANWWSERLSLKERPRSYRQMVEHLLLGMMEALREDPLMQKIVAWEMSEASPQAMRLSAARSKGMGIWIAQQRGDLSPPPDVDVGAVNALLIAAVQHVVLAGAVGGQFAGVPLRKGKDWERMAFALRELVAAAY